MVSEGCYFALQSLHLGFQIAYPLFLFSLPLLVFGNSLLEFVSVSHRTHSTGRSGFVNSTCQVFTLSLAICVTRRAALRAVRVRRRWP